MTRKTPIPNLDHLIERYYAGESTNEIGRSEGIEPSTLVKRFRKHGVKMRNTREASLIKAHGRVPDLSRAVRLFRAGESVNQIAKDLGVSRTAVVGELQRQGVEPRGQSAAEAAKWSKIKGDRRAVERQCSGAWEATRGRPKTREHMLKIARSNMERLTRIGRWETEIADELRRQGLRVTQQYAHGVRNLDIALDSDRVAVEIIGTKHHRRHLSKFEQRTKDLLSNDWSVLWLDCIDGCDPRAAAQQVIAFVEATRSHPSSWRQYRVVRSDGQPSTCPGLQFDHAALVG